MEIFQTALQSLFEDIGEDPNRKGLEKTPFRMTQMYRSFLTGYQEDSEELLGSTILLKSKAHQIITVPQIPFFSLCEHHLVPFFGQASLVYVPDQSILGVGRILNYVEAISRKLALQENLCEEIAQTLYKKLQAKALLFKMSAFHTCMPLSQKTTQVAKLSSQTYLGDENHYQTLTQEIYGIHEG